MPWSASAWRARMPPQPPASSCWRNSSASRRTAWAGSSRTASASTWAASRRVPPSWSSASRPPSPGSTATTASGRWSACARSRRPWTSRANAASASSFARASNHFGPISPYSLLAAEAGYASIIGSNATTTIAPTGGSDARLGNNPLGFGVPNPGGRPFLLDMAMSVVARAKIRNAAKRGEAIPPTWATDKDGRPTTDPGAALAGFLLPIGGHKGYGLALVVDLFAGLLSGASYLTHVSSWSENPERPQDLGHFFILIDTKRLGPPEELARRMQDFAAILHATPPADANAPVLVPGEIELDKLDRHRREGIAIDAELRSKLETLAARRTNK